MRTTKKNDALLGPAATYQHDHPPVRNVNVEYQAKLTFGQHVADKATTTVGSWPFMIVQSAVLAAWLVFNVYLAAMAKLHPGYLRAWDPYPFILLNLLLSFQAAYTGPVVMMSQNRQAAKDRLVADHDFEVNKKAEQEVEVVLSQLVHQSRLMLDALGRLEALQNEPATKEVAQRTDEILQRITTLTERIGNSA